MSRLTENLVARREIKRLAGDLHQHNKKIVFTNGVFDILHRGHVDYLTRAADLGDVLIVGLNSDSSVRRLKGPERPLQPERDRAAVLLALKPVDHVVIFSEDTPEKLIRQVRPDVLVKGADYQIDEIVGADFVKSCGGQVERIRLSQGRSSSRLIEILKSMG
jgi:rfaE bifunctional protein nucleotidyltransferase chain/domain